MAFVVDSNVVIMFYTNVYKRIMASQLLPPVNSYFRGAAPISLKWLPYSINEVNYNTPDTDTGLQFIKKKTTQTSDTWLWLISSKNGIFKLCFPT